MKNFESEYADLLLIVGFKTKLFDSLRESANRSGCEAQPGEGVLDGDEVYSGYI